MTAPTDRTRLRRLPDRGHHDRATIDAILDEALICHLGFVDAQGRPVVLPTIHTRMGDHVYVHGSGASHMLKRAAGDFEVCLTATLVDGLVLARSAFHHSMNYRSVVVFGAATEVGGEEKARALSALVEHVVPGRDADARTPNEAEMAQTKVLRIPLDEASAKVRTGDPKDDAEDMALPIWAGVVPVTTHLGEAVAAADLGAGIPRPDYLHPVRRAGERT